MVVKLATELNKLFSADCAVGSACHEVNLLWPFKTFLVDRLSGSRRHRRVDVRINALSKEAVFFHIFTVPYLKSIPGGPIKTVPLFYFCYNFRKCAPILTIFTARCTLVQSAVLRSHVVRLSVCLSVCLSVRL